MQFGYNDAGLPVTEYQQHGAAVNTSTSPKVEYAYDDTVDAAGELTKGLRLTRITYPNGRNLHYDYEGSAHDDYLNRVILLSDDDGSGGVGDTLADYESKRLGLDRIIRLDFPTPNLVFNLAHGTGNDPYDGLDRFGRVQDLLWKQGSTEVVRIEHGYDRASNRTYREDPVAAANSKNFDELYTYDGVNRLVNLQRGDVNTAQQTVSSRNFAQQWCLDATGNWLGFDQDDDGDNTWDLEQTRTHNPANEISDVDETAGPSWVTPVHDAAGNMTTIPQPADPSEDFDLTYDAWNRLVRVEEDGCPVAEYEYLCPCQLAGGDFFLRRGVGVRRCSGLLLAV